jgi:hypothetical protein
MTRFDARTGKTDESFLFWAFVQDPGPSVWRHVAVQYSQESGSLILYLDGKGVFDSKDRPSNYLFTESGALPPGNRPSAAKLLNNTTLFPHTAKRTDDYPRIAGKMAQLRVYPGLLSAAEVLMLSLRAQWPSGAQVRQCCWRDTDHDLQDTQDVDEDGRSCEWYHKAKREPRPRPACSVHVCDLC